MLTIMEVYVLGILGKSCTYITIIASRHHPLRSTLNAFLLEKNTLRTREDKDFVQGHIYSQHWDTGSVR